MNVSKVLTRDYKNDNDFRPGKTNPNKAKTNPNKPNSKLISEMLKMKLSSVKTKDYRNEPLCALRQNKPNSNPIFTKKHIFLAILSAEFCSNASLPQYAVNRGLAASAEAKSYYSTSSIGASWVMQQLGKITAQNQKYTISSPTPAQMIDIPSWQSRTNFVTLNYVYYRTKSTAAETSFDRIVTFNIKTVCFLRKVEEAFVFNR